MDPATVCILCLHTFNTHAGGDGTGDAPCTQPFCSCRGFQDQPTGTVMSRDQGRALITTVLGKANPATEWSPAWGVAARVFGYPDGKGGWLTYKQACTTYGPA